MLTQILLYAVFAREAENAIAALDWALPAETQNVHCVTGAEDARLAMALDIDRRIGIWEIHFYKTTIAIKKIQEIKTDHAKEAKKLFSKIK